MNTTPARLNVVILDRAADAFSRQMADRTPASTRLSGLTSPDPAALAEADVLVTQLLFRPPTSCRACGSCTCCRPATSTCRPATWTNRGGP